MRRLCDRPRINAVSKRTDGLWDSEVFCLLAFTGLRLVGTFFATLPLQGAPESNTPPKPKLNAKV
jgi:hypothetical protein